MKDKGKITYRDGMRPDYRNNVGIKVKVLRILGEIAPEADLENINADVELRQQIDLDSMDYLNFGIALDEEFNVPIPET